MSVTFKPAVRENVPLLIGLGGASGSGKTFSALELATGIAETIGAKQGRDGRVFFIDTERGRGLHYADRFTFMHGEVRPPFTPAAYGQGLTAAEEAGADVVVIDSFSHEWEGEGGVREWADKLAESMKPPANWKDPKMAHKRLVNQMLAARPHIIVCLRAEEKMRVENVPQTNPDGSPKMWNGKPSTKMVITAAADLPLRERWVPICEKRFPFEITTSLLLTPEHPGVPIPLKLQEQHMAAFPDGQRISREAGRFLAEWSMGAAPRAASGPTADDVLADLREAAAAGSAELRRVWSLKSTAAYRDQLSSQLEGLKAIAAQHDQPSAPPAQDQGGPDGYDGI